ncbi:MAG: PAS domain S-box protein [Breoghania sp.]|nr:PAS domain S-box protein [Breoghania sp.]
MEKKRSQEEAERLTVLANSTFEAIVITVARQIVDGNAALEELLGLPIAELKGKDVNALFLPNEEQQAPEGEESFSSPREMVALHTDGQRIPVEVRTREIVYRGEHTRVSAVVDLRDRKKAEELIRHLAQHDPLTDLPNRAVFTDRLKSRLSKLEETRRSASPRFCWSISTVSRISTTCTATRSAIGSFRSPPTGCTTRSARTIRLPVSAATNSP